MYYMVALISIPLLAGCGDESEKVALRDQQSRQILALDAELGRFRREMAEPVRELDREVDKALQERAELDREIAKQDSELREMLAIQRASVAKFEAYRKKHVLDQK